MPIQKQILPTTLKFTLKHSRKFLRFIEIFLNNKIKKKNETRNVDKTIALLYAQLLYEIIIHCTSIKKNINHILQGFNNFNIY
jgi:hypothetical protein